MNLLTRQCATLFAAACFLFTSACENNDTLDIITIPETDLAGITFTDTLVASVATISIDSVNTTSTGRFMAGRAEDPFFGATTAAAFSQFAVSFFSGNIVIGNETAMYDSVVLSLSYDYLFGDTTQAQSFQVHELNAAIDTAQARQYYNNSDIPVGDLLGDFTLVAANDSVRTITSRLSDSFGERLFAAGRANGTGFTQQGDVLATTHGIRISSTSTSSDAVVGFNLGQDSESFLAIYYREVNTSGDTLNRLFAFGFGKRFNQIKADLSTSQTLANWDRQRGIPAEELSFEGYMQASTGITTFLKFPGLENFDPDRKIVVNRAEIFFRPTTSSASGINGIRNVPSRFYLAKADENQTYNIAASDDPDTFVRNFQGNVTEISYNPAGLNYPGVNITRYVQDVIRGVEPNNGLILAPVNNNTSVNQVRLRAPGHQESPAIELKIYFTAFE